MRIPRTVWVSLLSMFAVLQGCSDDEPLLVVQTAQTQPIRDDLGVIVLIQSRGGAWLEVQTEGGVLENGQHSECLPSPQNQPLSQSFTTELVFPTLTEAVITVRLLDGQRTAAHEATEAGASGESGAAPSASENNASALPVGACGPGLTTLRQVTKPVARTGTMIPDAGALAPSSSGGSGGSGAVAGSGGAAMAGGGAGGGGGAVPSADAGASGDAGSDGTATGGAP